MYDFKGKSIMLRTRHAVDVLGEKFNTWSDSENLVIPGDLYQGRRHQNIKESNTCNLCTTKDITQKQ